MAKEEERKPCSGCDAKPGSLHELGCFTERCRMCGGQLVACGCAAKFGADEDGDATEEAYQQFDAEVEKLGGRMPWSGILYEQECALAREQGWFVRWAPGWVPCEATHPDAQPDLNRVAFASTWDPVTGKRIMVAGGSK